MRSEDELVERLKQSWGLASAPRISISLTCYSDLLRLVGKYEGLLLGTGLSLQASGNTEWGGRLTVEADRLGKSVSRVIGEEC